MGISASSVQHMLLTRFNVQAFGDRPSPGLDWLLHRTDLFENVCFPSVASQTDQDFLWLLLLDVETPMSVLQRLFRLQVRRSFELRFVSHFDESTVREEIRRFRTAAPYLLTTRLDNDDAIAKSYFSELRDYLEPTHRNWINFDHGLQVDQMGLYQIRRRSNAFISLLERDAEPQTVMCTKHSYARSVAPIKHIKGGAWWLQVVHGKNLMNYIHDPTSRLSWTDAEPLIKGFCDEVIAYVKNQYSGPRLESLISRSSSSKDRI